MTTHTDTAPITAKEIHAIYMGLVIMISLSALDQSIVATALPRIVTDLGGIAHLSWVVTAYVLASTAMMPLYGKLSDQYGRKPLLYTAIITFLAGSALCGLAQNMTELIAFRAIQGLGAGGFLPLAQIVIGDLVPPAERGKRQGSIAAVYAVASVLGPVLGGLLTDWLSWHWIFYVNVPVGAAALYVISKSLHHTSPHHAHKIDYLGSVLLTGAVTAALLVLALGGTQWPWSSGEVKYLSLLAAALTAALLWHVRRVPEPVLPPDLFHNRVFNVASAVLALTFVGMMGSSVFFPLLFQMVMGVSPAHSGLLTMPMMIGLVIASTQNGRVLAKFHGRYKPAQTMGLGLATLSFAVLAWGIASSAGYLVLEPAIFTLGAGLGLVMPNMTMAVQNALPANRRGVGTAMMTFFRSLGGLIGVTGSGAILAQRLHGQTATADLYRHAIGNIFATGTVLVGLGLLMLVFLPELPMVQHAPVRK
ncbi:DHA2 family efflux MFS transporter permease subunit [Duganella sp. BJB488]|uniref:MDR family MFS transporter n=1 Tax=unclassified Duganella TaxID=2636909 RepID=UPI000E34F75D|nr:MULTISPECIES: MDR family MFS transporter [unclassified Duganella]RFP11090.1 DHA2 family efflux MFS transporter permease subunit [Duganella sp. BJB489]RFP14361.1 DHA2 family efflux MFS transporter permease subunit [Duganella sp. BJB488]RFP30296.1 DHA2 family efflux MFS transporter permease subunit [Duganella sp. BJB480]